MSQKLDLDKENVSFFNINWASLDVDVAKLVLANNTCTEAIDLEPTNDIIIAKVVFY
jgi:hypothetical protein